MAITVLGNFLAYNVYRANCTRTGLADRSNPSAAGNADSFTTTYNDKELYMEFGELFLTEQGLPDGTPLDGLAVEVRVHFGGARESTGSSSNKWGATNFSLGICTKRIAADTAVTYNNLVPIRRYNYNDGAAYRFLFAYNTLNYRGDEDNYTHTGISRVLLYSSTGTTVGDYHTPCSPVDVLDAIRSSALVVRRDFERGGAYVYTTGEYLPYVEVIFGVVSPKVSNTVGSGYIDPYNSPTISWGYDCSDYIFKTDGLSGLHRWIYGGTCPQSSSMVEISKTDEEMPTEYAIDGTGNIMELPSEVIDAGNFSWRVKVESQFGAWSDYSSYRNVTTIDSISTAAANAPKNTYVNVDEVVLFDWTHTIATGTQQSKYELQGLLSGVWTTLQEEETSETSAVIPAEMLSSQITAWRVRTANNDGVYGEYSEPAKVIFVIAPTVEGVTVSGNVKPTVSWQAVDQQGYEIMIDDVSTGVRYGTEKSYVWEDLLSDGVHAVKVRVVNRYGLYSAWVEVSHTVANVQPETVPELYAAALANSDVRLEWTGYTGAETLIYRDGIVIDKITQAGSTYVDHTATGRHSYRVRAADADGNYADSGSVIVNVQLRETMLAVEGEWNWVELAYSSGAEPPVRETTLTPVYALNYYSGRAYPVVEMSAHKSAAYSVTYAVSDEQAANLRSMIGKIVVHKRKGELLRGLLQGITEARSWWGVDSTLQIVEVEEP